MAKRTTTPRRSKGKGRGKKPGSGGQGGFTWSQGEHWIAGGLLVLAVVATLVFVPSLRKHGEASTTMMREVRFASAPNWVGDSLLQHLAETAMHATGEESSPHNRATLARVRAALDETGWFAQVDQVQRASDGAIIVTGRFLAPTTIVEDQYGEAIVDAQGRLLPAQCQLDPTAHIIRLIHPRQHRPVRARRAWESQDVHAGLAVLNQIASKDWAMQINAIDLSQWHRNGRLVLMTDRDSRIIWGSAPGEETPLEAMADRKLIRLDHLFRSSGRVDQHHAGEIDLTDASVVVRR